MCYAPDAGRHELVGVHLGARVERRLGNGVGADFRDPSMGNDCENEQKKRQVIGRPT